MCLECDLAPTCRMLPPHTHLHVTCEIGNRPPTYKARETNKRPYYHSSLGTYQAYGAYQHTAHSKLALTLTKVALVACSLPVLRFGLRLAHSRINVTCYISDIAPAWPYARAFACAGLCAARAHKKAPCTSLVWMAFSFWLWLRLIK